jgi:hypothetical protein
MKKHIMILTVLTLFILALAACAGADEGQAPTELPGAPANEALPDLGETPTVSLGKGEVITEEEAPLATQPGAAGVTEELPDTGDAITGTEEAAPTEVMTGSEMAPEPAVEDTGTPEAKVSEVGRWSDQRRGRNDLDQY